MTVSRVSRLMTAFGAVAIALLLAPACRREAAPREAAPAAAPQPEAKRYDFRGVVVSIDKAGKNLVVDHEAIEGYMAAMTMAYPVKDERVFDSVAAGDRVTAKLVIGQGQFWLEDLTITRKATPKS